MPIFDFECPSCEKVKTEIIGSEELVRCAFCGVEMRKLPPLCSVVIKVNIGRKLKNRIALDDELKKQGFNAPLFRSDESKDFARWALKRKDRFV